MENLYICNIFVIYCCRGQCLVYLMGLIPKLLPVLSTELELHKIVVDRGLQVSTEQYGCRQRNHVIKCDKNVLFFSMFLHMFALNCCFKLFLKQFAIVLVVLKSGL